MMLWPLMTISPISPWGTSLSSISTTRTPTPHTGKPTEPGLDGRSSRLNVATGLVSDRPYPSRMATPNFSPKARMTSTGMAEPPDTASRRLRAILARSNFSGLGWLSMAQYIVGTPAKMVTLSRSMMLSAASGSKRGSSDSAA